LGQVLNELKRESGQSRSGHATVRGAMLQDATGGNFGKAQQSEEPSQENCLSDNHRLTCERWEGDLLALFARKEPLAFWQGVLFVG